MALHLMHRHHLGGHHLHGFKLSPLPTLSNHMRAPSIIGNTRSRASELACARSSCKKNKKINWMLQIF